MPLPGPVNIQRRPFVAIHQLSGQVKIQAHVQVGDSLISSHNPDRGDAMRSTQVDHQPRILLTSHRPDKKNFKFLKTTPWLSTVHCTLYTLYKVHSTQYTYSTQCALQTTYVIHCGYTAIL